MRPGLTYTPMSFPMSLRCCSSSILQATWKIPQLLDWHKKEQYILLNSNYRNKPFHASPYPLLIRQVTVDHACIFIPIWHVHFFAQKVHKLPKLFGQGLFWDRKKCKKATHLGHWRTTARRDIDPSWHTKRPSSYLCVAFCKPEFITFTPDCVFAPASQTPCWILRYHRYHKYP